MRLRSVVSLILALACGPALAGVAQLPYARQALDIGRSRDDALYEAFTRGYQMTAGGGAEGGAIDRAEVITEFRRAVLIVRARAAQGEYGFGAQDLTRAMAPFAGQVTFAVEVRLHPLHTYTGVPAFSLYIATGPTMPPLAPKPFTRDPIYPPGAAPGSAIAAVRLEGAFARAGIEAAAAPELIVTDERADVIWRARLDLSRYR